MFSKELLQQPDARSAAARARIALAKSRIQSVLDREIVAHQKTLEKKISDQGRNDIRVDPHLVGLALLDLFHLNRIKVHTHPSTGRIKWYSNLLTPQEDVDEKLSTLAPLYAHVSQGDFGNLTGDALEIVTYKCLELVKAARPRFDFQGYWKLEQPKANGRFQCVKPPKTVGSRSTNKEADFIQFGYEEGGIFIECKNLREWFYPTESRIKELIFAAYELDLIPLLIARRIHYTTKTNFLDPAGIIAHESYFHYYPSDQSNVADQVRDKRSLGFTDVRATETPDKRTIDFFDSKLPGLVSTMAPKWHANKEVLFQYATNEINLAQLYNAIGSRAAGNWIEREEEQPENPYA